MFKRLLIALFVLIVAFFLWFFQATRPVSNSSSTVDFEIQSGWSIDRIGQELSIAKLIRSRSAFKITVVTLGISSKIQAGYFRLSPSMSITEIAQALTKAYAKQVRVTIPEGLRRQEIALILDKAFKNADGHTFSVTEFVSLTADKEGRLFPETYDFDPQASTSAIVARLESQFNSVVSKLNIKSADLNTVLTLASLLQREAGKASEMPEIAGVIENRLGASWPLQIDATVQYALANSQCKNLTCDWWPKSLTSTDLQFKSPYNTYLNQGLPPKPICNPGKEALAAAASPKATSAWFYLHDGSGQIHFADTMAQHNQNVCTYLHKDCL
jgi:UPF0755 protein